MTPGVVVVAYGSAELLAAAITPLRDLPLVVVDNSSQPAVAAVCAAADVVYVDPGSNRGFAAGVNLGVSTLRERFGRRDVLLLNPDAVLGPDGVAVLVTALNADAHLAAVSPLLMGPDGEPQRVAWPWPTPPRMWREALGLLGVARARGDWLVGAALLLKADAYDEVGPFDERFFLYAEETDWQRRAIELGWRVAVVDGVTAKHAGAGTSADPRRRELLFHAGTETYVRKWHGTAGWVSYRSAAVVGALLRSVRPGGLGAAARRRAYLFARGPRRAVERDR